MCLWRERERKKIYRRKKTLLPVFSIHLGSFFSCVQAILKSHPTTISSLLTVLILFKLLLLLLSSFHFSFSFSSLYLLGVPINFLSLFSEILLLLFWVLVLNFIHPVVHRLQALKDFLGLNFCGFPHVGLF